MHTVPSKLGVHHKVSTEYGKGKIIEMMSGNIAKVLFDDGSTAKISVSKLAHIKAKKVEKPAK